MFAASLRTVNLLEMSLDEKKWLRYDDQHSARLCTLARVQARLGLALLNSEASGQEISSSIAETPNNYVCLLGIVHIVHLT
jgi:hypothetical protein